MPYNAPIRDLVFATTEIADLEAVSQLPGYGEATPDLLEAILEEAGRFGSEVLAPINHSGDQQGVRLEDGQAVTAAGWKEAYAQFVEGGWNGLPFDPELGGQGLPWLVSTAVVEIWHAANMSFSLCPLLTQGAIEAIQAHGTPEQQAAYLPKLVSGEWTGTMNLTEPQAGSDLSAVRSQARPNGDHYLISGQKIFITYGDHDMAENIIHLVLARTPDAPEGVKGISLFIVPKFLPDADGRPTIRNDIETLSLEKKLGIHASPTAVLGYGNNAGAVGYLVGEENRGLMYMFTMMNVARHAVGIEGYAVADRAYQQAVEYASQRVQGRAIDQPDGERVPIIRHPDIKRMLLLQKCRNEALRSLSLTVAAALDHAEHQPEGEARTRAREMVEVMIPIVKGYATEMGLENVSLALQVHGGMGFIEETGAAQHYRDQRITPIYEGTTGIQALDLAGRKLTRDGGAMTARVIERIRAECTSLTDDDPVGSMKAEMEVALDALTESARHIVAVAASSAELPAAIAEPYLRLWGVVACGWQMIRAADACVNRSAEDSEFYRNKLTTTRFYFDYELPRYDYCARVIRRSADTIAGIDPAMFETA